MRALLREPLLHFVLLGVALFVAYTLRGDEADAREPGDIVVTQGQIEHLATGFTKTWQRPPTSEELASLVRDRVREEVYFREALALGLDREDTIIRRRLRQKLEFVSDDIAAIAEPTDAELEEFLRAHPDSFRVDSRFTFQQVCLDPQKHGDALATDAAQLLAQLERAGSDVDLSALGDSRMLEPHYERLTATEVARHFGEPFALALARVRPGSWQGPFESGYGVHLVHVSERVDGRVPALAEARDVVRREWADARRVAANEAFYQELLARYRVTIESAETATPTVSTAK